MKSFLVVCMSLISSLSIFSQICEPNPIFTEIGIWPITAEPACQGEPYEQIYTIVAPSVIDAATVKILTNGSLCTEVNLCSFSVGNIQGFPEGLTLECLEPSCIFEGGGTSCLLLSGTTNVDPGVYNVSFDLTILIEETLCFIPIIIPIDQGAVVVQSSGSCTVGIEETEIVSNLGWTISANNLILNMDSERDLKAQLNVYSMNGQIVRTSNLYISPGPSRAYIEIGELTNGIYVVELLADSQRQLIKIAINR